MKFRVAENIFSDPTVEFYFVASPDGRHVDIYARIAGTAQSYVIGRLGPEGFIAAPGVPSSLGIETDSRYGYIIMRASPSKLD